MGGGGAFVDGFRRLFHRRTASSSNSNQSSAGDESSELEVVEDPDLVRLHPIRVPKRKMPLPSRATRRESKNLTALHGMQVATLTLELNKVDGMIWNLLVMFFYIFSEGVSLGRD